MLTKALTSDRKVWNKNALQLSLMFTFLWGLAAHGYMFLSSSISHDSIDEFLLVDEIVAKKISLGRIFVPIVGLLRGRVTALWLVGLIGLLCIGLTVYFVTRIFEIENKWMICLVSGVFTVNITVIAVAATYMHDFDCDSLALLFSVLAVFFWKSSENAPKYIYGGASVMFSLGLYQSYISMTITLIIFCCILWLLDGRSCREVLAEGIKGIAMLIIGGLMYLCVLKISTYLMEVSLASGRANSLDHILELTPGRIVTLCFEAWFITIKKIFSVCSAYPGWFVKGMHILVLGVIGLFTVSRLMARDIRLSGKVLTLALFALLPLGSNVSHVLANGVSHDLMYGAFWMVYLLPLLLADRQRVWTVWSGAGFKRYVSWIPVGLVAVILWGNVQMANGIYTSKRLVQQANLSLFTRITYSMEQYPGYVAGETPVVFIGRPSGILTELPETFQRYDLIFAGEPFVVGSAVQAHYQCYFKYVLMNPAVIAPDSHKYALMQREDVANMPAYPAKGSIAMVDGTLAVKLGQ